MPKRIIRCTCSRTQCTDCVFVHQEVLIMCVGWWMQMNVLLFDCILRFVPLHYLYPLFPLSTKFSWIDNKVNTEPSVILKLRFNRLFQLNFCWFVFCFTSKVVLQPAFPPLGFIFLLCLLMTVHPKLHSQGITLLCHSNKMTERLKRECHRNGPLGCSPRKSFLFFLDCDLWALFIQEDIT